MKIDRMNKVYGWSKSVFTNSYVIKVNHYDDIFNTIKYADQNNKVISIRSAGNSYGDNTLNEGQIILDISNLNKIIKWDSIKGVITVQSGVSFFQILSITLKDNWIPPVMPGSGLISIGGALSNNIHGKNCFTEGFFSEQIISFKMIFKAVPI